MFMACNGYVSCGVLPFHSIIADIGDNGHPLLVRYNEGSLYMKKYVQCICTELLLHS
jgi:hypothetical protein